MNALRLRSHRCLRQLTPLAARACAPDLLVPLRLAPTQSAHSSFIAGLPRVAGALNDDAEEKENEWEVGDNLPLSSWRGASGSRPNIAGGGLHCAAAASATAARAKRERAQRRSPRCAGEHSVGRQVSFALHAA